MCDRNGALGAEPQRLMDGYPSGPVIIDESLHPTIRLTIDIATVLKLDQPAGTIIIGNPEIAGVALHDSRTVVINGRTVGRTNMIVLDETGTQISDVLLRVGTGARPNQIVIHQGLQRQTYSCEPNCELMFASGGTAGGTGGGGQGGSEAGGECENPDDIAADGSRCGDRAASVRPGGR